MAQRSLFFNHTETETRVYYAEDDARYNYLMMAGQGIAKQGDYEAYKVLPKQNMVVTIDAGAAFIKGYLHEVYDTAEELELDAADPTNDRIDRIVLRFINVTTEREIRLEVLKGAPSANPTPPSVTRTEDIIELSIAQIRVVAGKSFIEESQITDEKNNPLVCGYSPLHNLLRGVQVDENGLASMPNQSYLEIVNTTGGITINGDTTLPLDPVKHDRQDEALGNVFKAKSSGAYTFFVYVAFDEVLSVDTDVQIRYMVNGSYVANVVARGVGTYKDNIFGGAAMHYLNAGDELHFLISVSSGPSGLTTRNHRVGIAKLN